MNETRRAIATLPSLDVELVHDKTDDGQAERVAIRVTGRPDLKTASKLIEGELLPALTANNSVLNAQQQALKMWLPLLRMNPFLAPLLPPADKQD
ncbi:MAG: hypothetical protein AAFX81_17485 [Pseudomonadota bacterium]